MSTDVSRQEAKEDSQNYADKKTLKVIIYSESVNSPQKGLRVPKADLALIDALAKEKMKHLHTRYQVKVTCSADRSLTDFQSVSKLVV